MYSFAKVLHQQIEDIEGPPHHQSVLPKCHDPLKSHGLFSSGGSGYQLGI